MSLNLVSEEDAYYVDLVQYFDTSTQSSKAPEKNNQRNHSAQFASVNVIDSAVTLNEKCETLDAIYVGMYHKGVWAR